MTRISKILCLFLLILFTQMGAFAQQQGSIRGKIKNAFNKPVSSVNVRIEGLNIEELSDSAGNFSFFLEAGRYVLEFSHVSFPNVKEVVTVRPGATELLYVTLKEGGVEMETQVITDNKDPKDFRDPTRAGFELFPIEPRKVVEMPSFKSDIESKLNTMPGVATNNEFSSQYRVRGGNFDENLIYVNDIEIYRPILIRSGQQEGLGFVNANLASDVAFSTGGFAARYGDKMSSALDVKYKEPDKFQGTVEAGIIGQNIHFEGSTKNKEDKNRPGRFSYLVGARRFAPSYILKSLDTDGDYKPQFYDLQGLFTYSPKHKTKGGMRSIERKNGSVDTIYIPSQRIKISAFFNVAYNNYRFVPRGRITQFGTIQSVLRLRVAFEGQEKTTYLTGQGALMLEHKPTSRLSMKYIISYFRSVESEVFDVEGGYYLSDVNTSFGNEGFNEVVFDRGIGTNYKHARNFLTADVISIEQKAKWFPDRNYRHLVEWGVRAQQQVIDDQVKEWNGVDSAGYFILRESFRNEATVNTRLYKAYIQDNWKLNKKATFRLVAGARLIYNELNNEFLVAPRVMLIFDPTKRVINPDSMSQEEFKRWKRSQFQLRISGGMYHQPAFYREMRDFEGTVHTDIKAQTSVHSIVSLDYQFKIWRRPFKIQLEGYYKYMYNLIPYEVDNVRLRYYPDHPAVGFATGLDLKINGQFIRGVDSWLSFGVLKTMENSIGDTIGWIPRPTDQRFSFAMYFEDELPINPTYKVHINFVYGSGMRVGPPGSLENKAALRTPAYNRVDLGFSKMFLFKTREERGDKFGIESLWITAEVFNLFQRANTVSYTWIKDVFNNQFAVPNYLSARLFNVRVVARF